MAVLKRTLLLWSRTDHTIRIGLDPRRSPFSLLLDKSVGPNNFWLRQFEIVGVGVTIEMLVLQMGRKCPQQKGQNSSQHRHFYNVGSQKLLAQPFCPNNWGKGVLHVYEDANECYHFRHVKGDVWMMESGIVPNVIWR